MELVWLELKLLFSYPAYQFARDPVSRAIFLIDTVEFSWTLFFMSWRFLVVFSAASRMVTGVAGLLEPFDGPPDIWRCDAKRSRNVAEFLAHVTPKFCILDKASLKEPLNVTKTFVNKSCMQYFFKLL